MRTLRLFFAAWTTSAVGFEDLNKVSWEPWECSIGLQSMTELDDFISMHVTFVWNREIVDYPYEKRRQQCIIAQATITHINSSPPGQNGCRFADVIFRCIFMNEKFCILIKISLKFFPKGPIDNEPVHWRIYAALVGDELTWWPWLGLLNWYPLIY